MALLSSNGAASICCASTSMVSRSTAARIMACSQCGMTLAKVKRDKPVDVVSVGWLCAGDLSPVANFKASK